MKKDSLFGREGKYFFSLVAIVVIGALISSYVAKSNKAAHTTTYGVTGSALTVHKGEKSYRGQIIAPRIIINGICLIQVKPDGAKDDGAFYPAIIDCALNPVKGGKVIITDYTITPPHHLPDTIHIAEKLP